MNFYKHHLGDYDGATAHLSWDEDMAYTRLLRAYYRREKPILAEEAHRIVRATTKQQKAAVDAVLTEFFVESSDGWHNKRADEEIATYNDGAEERAQKIQNETERMRRYRERRKEIFDTLRERGIVPKWDITMEDLQRILNAPATRTGGVQSTACNAPATANQIPEPEPEKDKIKTTPLPPKSCG